MSFELLSNELLLYIFEFLHDVHIFRAFYGLNYRFESLLFTQRQNYCLDFRSASRHDFEIIFEKYISFISDRINSLCFSGDDDTPQQIQHFLDRNLPLCLFSNLRSLSFNHLHSYEIMEEITEEWRFLPHLTHLSFIQCYMEQNTEKDYQLLVNNIWCFPNLIYCCFGVSFPGNVYFSGLTVTSSFLEHLTVKYVNFHFSGLANLVVHTPRIRHLDICINEHFIDQNLSLAIPSLISLKLHVHNAAFAIRKLLQCMPNLSHLTVKLTDTYFGNLTNALCYRFQDDILFTDFFQKNNTSFIYMDGLRWEEIIVNHLPKLKTFRLKMDIQYWSRNNKEDEVNKLLKSFRSHFWIRERRWFVRCDWNPEHQSSYFCLYTLPYAFDRFDSHTAPIRSKSTSNKKDYWCYDRVYNLHYHFSLSNSSALGRVCFSNIRHLSVELPSDDHLWSALPTFYHLKSLCIFILNDDLNCQKQLQILLDRAPNLYSLIISCGNLSASELTLLKNSSGSVRRLNLYGYTELENRLCFNCQQCAALCNSPLGIQCEMLQIRVENPMDVLELVYSMLNLRALNVQILNDKYNLPNFGPSSTVDELLQFLQHSLDSTCIVTRNQSDSRYIHMWIR